MRPSQIVDPLRRGVELLGQRLSDEALSKCARLLCELERWNAKMNLTAMRGTAAMINGHVLDSLSLRPVLCGRTVADVGTGAGFPGLPIAIAEPGIEIELLDSNARKIAFVRHMIGELDLGNATAVRARAEAYAPGRPFDTVIARGLGPVPRLIELAGHLLAEEGVMLAQKGRYPAAELAGLPDAWEFSARQLAVPGLDERHVIILRRRSLDA